MPEKIGDGVLNWASMLDPKAREQALVNHKGVEKGNRRGNA